MKKIITPFLAFLAISCHNGSDTATNNPAGSGDSAFRKMSDEFLDRDLAAGPESAVALGFHKYDGKLTDYSKPAVDSELIRLKAFDQRLGALDTTALSPAMFYDYRILQAGVRNEIFTIEDRLAYTRNPMTYAGAIDANLYLKRNYAPLEDRVRSIISIEKGAPAVFAAARANLDDSLGKPLIEMAIEVAQGSAAFLGKDLVVGLKDLKNDSLKAAFTSANKTAIGAINGYVDYLKKTKMPKANNKYAIGNELYKKMLLYQEDIDISPDEILAIGLKELKKEQESFNAAARIIDSGKKPIDVYHEMEKEHPTADSLIPDARKKLESIRQFLVDHKIITIPSEVRAICTETPEYARATSTASMDIPGPFEKKATEAYYYITPVDAKWTVQQKEDWLASFNIYTTDIVSIHEAYPGHYVQFLHLNASNATKVEKIYSSYAFVEGWAHYTEKMLVDEGYGNTGDPIKAAKYRMAQSGDALLRLCRLCVSIETHCHNISVDSATCFFMDNWYQGEKPSRLEALRGTFDPGYLFYTIGKLEILKLREDYRKQEGTAFSLQKFHDLMLDNGMPPIRLLRERLLKDKSTWGAIL
ncbi:MAG TPA: DUF885 domain-containing protein [Puia sp.]|nr:DUF885 domain-containing protein [Puia sp.]